MQAELLIDAGCTLAEGIQWCADQQRLWWTDIHGCKLWSCDADGGGVERYCTHERLGSFAFDAGGRVLGAFESGLFRWDLERGRLDRLAHFEPGHPTSRLNDGRCDRAGRFVVGGMDEDGLRLTSSVVRYDGQIFETIRHSVGCSNAICFSPDGRWMYFADTPSRTILRLPYDTVTGEIGEATVFVRLSDSCAGFPDGACVDADGSLWNARFNGAKVQQILPDGRPGLRIDLPVPQVTCACFGGPELDRLYITTGRENMTPEQIAAAPLSGGIFVARPGARGLPEDRLGHDLFSD